MGTPEQAMHLPAVELRGPSHRMAWALWIIASVIGAVLAALVAWQIRTFFIKGPAFVRVDVRDAATGGGAPLIIAFVSGALRAARVAWQVRTFFIKGPAFVRVDVRYAATVVEALIFGGAQWFVWRRYRFELDWWVPASLGATLSHA